MSNLSEEKTQKQEIPRVIGEKWFPVKRVSEEARKEKNGRSPIFEMHYWWTRKPLITARSAILASALPENYDRKKFLHSLLGLMDDDTSQKKRAYHHSLHAHLTELAKEYEKVFGKKRPLLLDPFAGGGSIPYEALRAGFDVIANDYNPVAYLILKATLEYPKKFGQNLLKEVKNAFNELRKKLKEELSDYYPPSPFEKEGWIPHTYIMAWAVKCPHCGFVAPLVNNWRLRQKKVKSKNNKNSAKIELTYMNPIVEGDELKIEITTEIISTKELRSSNIFPQGTSKGGNGICLRCGNTISNKTIVKDIRDEQREILLCVIDVHSKEKRKRYRLPTRQEKKTFYELSESVVFSDILNYIPTNIMPELTIASARYLGTWEQLFNPRQRLFLAKYSREARKIAEQYKENKGEEFAKAIIAYLALLMAKLIDYNSRGTSWHRTGEKIRDSLAFRRPSINWDHCEIHPFAPTGSGTWNRMSSNVLKGLEQAVADLVNTEGEVIIKNESILSMTLSEKADLVVTDPPYGDDVQYSELSEFFYSWQYLLIKDFFEELENISLPPREEDLSDNKKDRTSEIVKMGLSQAFNNLHDAVKKDGIISLFFAHSSRELWNFVIQALNSAGYVITSTFPIHTENPNNVLARYKASFFTSVLIIARKREITENTKAVYLEDLEEEMGKSVKTRISAFWKEGLRGSDLSMASLGPILEILTKFPNVKSMTGLLHFDEILSLATKYLVEYVMGQFDLISNLIDNTTAVYVYLRVNNMIELPFDALRVIAMSEGTSVKDLEETRLLTVKKEKGIKIYRLQSFSERPDIKEPVTLIDVIHMGMKTFQKEGTSGFWEYISTMGEDRKTVENLLKVISQGIMDNNKVTVILDEDAKVAREILAIGESRQTTLTSFT